MLKKHELMRSGELGDISITKHRIDLIPNARFISPPYRTGPKTRELEQFEVEKQLKVGVIEPTILEWASPVLFAPKKDSELRLFTSRIL